VNQIFIIVPSVTVYKCPSKRNEALTSVVMKSAIFWDITSSSPLKLNRRFGGTYSLFFTLVSSTAYSSTLNMEVDFQRTMWRYVPEDSTLQ
jgi:hypothetical protein